MPACRPGSGQPRAQEQGLGWVSERNIPHGVQLGPRAEPHAKEQPLPQASPCLAWDAMSKKDDAVHCPQPRSQNTHSSFSQSSP